jgi:hypothetical protein
MIDGVKILTMKNVVVVIRNVVVTSLVSTTTYCSVVVKLTTENIMWSLIVLTMELLQPWTTTLSWSLITFNDHIRTFNDHISCH